MDFKSILTQLSQLSEAETRKIAGRAYGGAAQHDDEEDDDGTDTKKVKHDTPKRGRGRPPKTGAHTQSPEEKKRLKSREEAGKQLQSYIVGNQPKKSKELEKLPKTKHSLKEWVEEVEQKYVTEAEQITMEPAKQNTQVIKQGTKTLGTVSNPQLAAQIKQSIGKGEMSLTGDDLGEDSTGDYSAKKARAGKDIGKPGKQFSQIAKSAGEKYGSKERGEKVAGAVLAKLRKKVSEADIPSDQVDMGAGLGAGRNNKTFEGKKPDFLDLDKDKNKKEPMSDAAKDAEKKKKKLKENAHKHSAARLLGKAHALARESYNCKYDDLDEVKMYHEGYKEGLDECYGQGVYEGVAEGSYDLDEVSSALANRAANTASSRADDAEEENDSISAGELRRQASRLYDLEADRRSKERLSPAKYRKMKLAAAQDVAEGSDAASIWKAEASKVGGYSNIDWYGMGFEHGKKGMFMNPPYGIGAKALQLYSKGFDKAESESLEEADMEEGNAFTAALAKTPKGEKFTLGGKSFTDTSNYGDSLGEMAFESLDKQLNDLLNETSVSEGMSVSISKGNQGAPDTVSITAQDGEADQLLSIIKQWHLSKR